MMGRPSESIRILRPGDITPYMALPWQADFLECNETWWPIPRPDDLLDRGSQKKETLVSREKWARGFDGKVFH